MGETFYTVLGVSRDADRETIRGAYRDQIKEAHPDVSDSPDAGERFKRLTTARDVLVDDDERRRYHRLGHDTYVRRHVETPVWTAASPAEAGPTQTATDSGGATADQSTGGETASTGRATTDTRETTASRGQGATPDGGYGASWQQAPEEYMRTTGYTESTPGRTMTDIIGRLGPWLLVHVVLLSSAVGTGAFVLVRAINDPTISLPSALFLVLMLSLVVVISVLHLLTEAYT